MNATILKTEWQKVTWTAPAQLVAEIDACLRIVGGSRNAWITRQILLAARQLEDDATAFREKVMGGKSLHSRGRPSAVKTPACPKKSPIPRR